MHSDLRLCFERAGFQLRRNVKKQHQQRLSAPNFMLAPLSV